MREPRYDHWRREKGGRMEVLDDSTGGRYEVNGCHGERTNAGREVFMNSKGKKNVDIQHSIMQEGRSAEPNKISSGLKVIEEQVSIGGNTSRHSMGGGDHGGGRQALGEFNNSALVVVIGEAGGGKHRRSEEGEYGRGLVGMRLEASKVGGGGSKIGKERGGGDLDKICRVKMLNTRDKVDFPLEYEENEMQAIFNAGELKDVPIKIE
ncbi:hypothetical protein LIER_22448 [Lithospermum erythrorhizon]|uniref:Uncharacterized protein n=1 Tax=Lithospermum erythrorhizon TaxID=34254 RepID=A0AAV3QVI1_LITER